MDKDLTEDFHFSITDVKTTTFPLPSDRLTLDRNRRFFVSVNDGSVTKQTRVALLHRRSLHWSEILDGFIARPSSQITLQVFEKHYIRQDNLLATFMIPYQTLRSSRTGTVQFIDTSKTKKSVSKEIEVTWIENPRLVQPVPAPTQHSSQTANEPILIASCRTNDIEAVRSHIQNAKEDAARMKGASGLAVGAVRISMGAGQVLDTVNKAVPSMEDFVAKCKVVADQLDFVVRAVDAIAEIHPYAKIAWSVISFIPKKISEQIQLDRDVIGLLDTISIALDLEPSADELRTRCMRSKNHEMTFVRLLTQINECGHFIQSYVLNDGFWQRILKNSLSNRKTVVDNYRQSLEKLRDQFLREVIVTVEINVFRVLSKMEEVSENIKQFDIDRKLHELSYGEGTEFDRNKGCLPQTRVKFLDAIDQWINDLDPSSPKMLALFGQAGTGKSSIAHEIAHRYNRINRLVTSYFFIRGSSCGREPYRFFTTIARDLCRICPSFKETLGGIIDTKPELAHVRNYTTLMEALLRKPIEDFCVVGPVFIIIDALDENEDATHKPLYSGGNSVPFHTALLQFISELPPNFRILITSRPEAVLEKAFLGPSFVRRLYIDDSTLAARVDMDIRTYVNEKLRDTGISQNDLQKLARKAEGLFQWAAVACDYIAYPPFGLDSQFCLQTVLHPTVVDSEMALKPLDELYTTILRRFNINSRVVSNNFKSVMGQILGAFEPLSVDSLDVFVTSKGGSTNVSTIVKDLGSLLNHVTPAESALPVAPLHTSLRDFLTDKARSGDFYIDMDVVHAEFALATLRIMKKELKFNICQLETSHLLNSEVPDLKKRVDDNISAALSYSCRFWVDHVTSLCEFNSDVFECLRSFMKKRFLFWLEVLSVRGEVAVAKTALMSLQGWLIQLRDKVDIVEIDALVKDAIGFVRYFGYPIAQSAPHIYLSALPFSPSSSIISELYTPRLRTLLLESGRLARWPALEMTIPVPADGEVRCIAWSRDCEYIAAGVDLDVHVWCTSTGIRFRGLYRVRTGVVSLAFSHDGNQLALGLWGGKVWIWDLVKGTTKEIPGPWTQTNNWTSWAISSVAFAEDIKQLVLGSHDGRVWVWNLEKAEAVGEPFVGHDNPVWAVSFLDEEHVVSRSGFRTVQVWNVKTRERVTRMDVATGTVHSTLHFGPDFIPDHSRVRSGFDVSSWTEVTEGEETYKVEWIWSTWTPAAAFSPDGKLVATCSPSHVHIWFAMGRMTGNLAGGPFSNEGTICLAFSGDGRRIASGTKNGSLRVWNARLADEGACESIARRAPFSVAFMPDGEAVVIGWRDGGVEVWDISTGEDAVKIADGDNRENWTFVAVSLNGDRIASTRGNEMYIWTRTGEAVAGPLTSSDSELISQVTFSPDSDDLVAHGTEWGTVCVSNASTSALVAGPMKFDATVASLALSPSTSNDSTTMNLRVAVGALYQLFIWDTQTGDVAGPFTHHSLIYALVFSSDGKFVTSVTDDYTLCVWDSSKGKTVRGPVKLHEHWEGNPERPSNRRIALALNGRRVALTGINNSILLFDVLYEGDADIAVNSVSILGASNHPLNFFAFSRDGQYLAVPSNNRTVKIWCLQTILEHKQAVDNSASTESEVFNLAETWIDSDGWAVYGNGEGGKPPFRRLIWVPEIHRSHLYRPGNMWVVGRKSETRLNLENFVHGKNWGECWLGFEQI